MNLEPTWRWFGPKDPVTLAEVRQTGATGIVTALHHIPRGVVWTQSEIRKRKQLIEAAGMKWSVAESIPVHEEIKRRRGSYRRYIENYRQSIANLGRCGVETLCYHFMPVLDWSRTDLRVLFHDGSITTRFEMKAFAAFDCFVLKRPGAKDEYDGRVMREAETYYRGLDARGRGRLRDTILLGFPGSGERLTPASLRAALDGFQGITENELREHLVEFLKEIVPVAEEEGVMLAIHPDDPPWPLFGVPRVVSTKSDVEFLLSSVDKPANGITLCAGSFGARTDNNVKEIAEAFAPRIHFAHLRNITSTNERDFYEDNHLEGNVDMWGVMKALVVEQERREREGKNIRRLPFRPDHGHLMIPESKKPNIYPGYSLFGRMRGLSELRGLEMGIRGNL